jgi:hypothetical protein
MQSTMRDAYANASVPTSAAISVNWLNTHNASPNSARHPCDSKSCKPPFPPSDASRAKKIWAGTAERVFGQRVQRKKVKYFEDTDTLYIEFRDTDIAESKDLDENTVLDVDAREPPD